MPDDHGASARKPPQYRNVIREAGVYDKLAFAFTQCADHDGRFLGFPELQGLSGDALVYHRERFRVEKARCKKHDAV